MHMNDSRWLTGKPRNQQELDWLQHGNQDVNFNDSIKPEEIVAIHLPWHHVYRYLVSTGKVPDVLAGKYDYLLAKQNDNSKAVAHIKQTI